MNELLAGLEDVEWGRYHHAYGPATDVPELLTALIEPERASERLRAAARKQQQTLFDHVTWTLYGNVFHQGSVWGVSAKVVPFIARVARAPSLPLEKRRFAVGYLHHLARGYPDQDFPQPFALDALLAECAPLDAQPMPRAIRDGDAFGDAANDLDESLTQRVHLLWVRDCFLAVEREVPSLVPLLDETDDALVGLVLSLAASFPRQRAATRDAMWKLAREETDTVLGGQALLALGALRETGVSDAARVLCDAVTAGGEHPGGLYAAAADVLFGGAGDGLSPTSIDHVLNVPADWLELDCPFTGSLESLVNRAMVQLPPSARDAVVASLSQSLARAQGFGKLDPMANLLRLGEFSEREANAPLTAQQRAIVSALAAHGDWGGRAVNANQAGLLRSCGLPDTREGLQRLVERT